MSKLFRPCSLDQPFLLPPSLQDWLPEDHLARFIAEVSETLDLSQLYNHYERNDGRGLAAYHPLLLTRVLLYAYATGRSSSRRIEQATYDDVAFRYLAADQHPDHDTIANFRQEHLKALAGLFVQVLCLCQRVGLVKLGHVAIDGTKLWANASPHRSLRYPQLREEEQRYRQIVAHLLAEAARVDAEEDQRYGKGKKGKTLPRELATAQRRLECIRQAQQELEEEARQEAAEAQRAQERYVRRRGRPRKGDPPVELDTTQRRTLRKRWRRAQRRAAEPQRHYNFTDPESRMMRDNGLGICVQAYNAQLAVDAAAQIIVAAEVTQEATDRHQLLPVIEQVRMVTKESPACITADAGYWHTADLIKAQLAGLNVLVPPNSENRKKKKPSYPLTNAAAQSMRQKLTQPANRAFYAKRQTTVEPVIAQIKETRGFRRFRFRGYSKVQAEWRLICLTHNLLKLFRRKWQLALP
jgi:transposase